MRSLQYSRSRSGVNFSSGFLRAHWAATHSPAPFHPRSLTRAFSFLSLWAKELSAQDGNFDSSNSREPKRYISLALSILGLTSQPSSKRNVRSPRTASQPSTHPPSENTAQSPMFSRALAAPWSPANKIFPSPAALPGTNERFWVAQVHHAFGDSPASAGTSDSADPELRQPRQNNAATTIHIESARFLKTSPFILKSD